MPSLIILLQFIITLILSSKFHSQNRHGHVFALATQNCLCPDPQILVIGLDGLSAIQFVPDLTLLIAEVESLRTSLVSRHISKSLASKLKSLALASKPTSPRKCSVLGSRTALSPGWMKRKILE